MSSHGRASEGDGRGASGARGLRMAARRLMAAYVEAPVTGFLSRVGLTPNALTLAGLVVAAASAYLAASGLLAAAGLTLLASGVFDLFDGALARATGRATGFGALLDSVVDRLSEGVALLGVLIYYAEAASTPGVVLAYLALAGSVMVSYTRARAEALGIDCDDGLMTRPERVVVLSAALVAAHWWTGALGAALGAIAFLTILTMAQRMIAARGRLRDRG